MITMFLCRCLFLVQRLWRSLWIDWLSGLNTAYLTHITSTCYAFRACCFHQKGTCKNFIWPLGPMVGEVRSSMISTLNQVDLSVEVAKSSHPGGHSRILSQVWYIFYIYLWDVLCIHVLILTVSFDKLYDALLHLPSATLSGDEKMAALGLYDQLPSAQGLLQAQLPFKWCYFCLYRYQHQVCIYLYTGTSINNQGDNWSFRYTIKVVCFANLWIHHVLST